MRLCGVSILLVLTCCSSSDARRRRNLELVDYPAVRAAAATPCAGGASSPCCGDSVCAGAEDVFNCLADCPGVTTEPTCGEEQHSDRGGVGLTFGVGFRAASAQDCCDKCKAHAAAHPRPEKRGRGPCNSWTFCGLPVCWGLDSGWNHTYGECWLRHLADPANPTFGQRGELSTEYRRKHMLTRKGCKTDQPWACPPTHVPWTSGSLNAPPVDRTAKWQTSGGWGNMIITRIA